MALHIRDPRTEEAVRKLARQCNVTLTDAVRMACEAALEHKRRDIPVEELLSDLHAKLRALPDTGVKLDKKFYDDLWGEDEIRSSGD